MKPTKEYYRQLNKTMLANGESIAVKEVDYNGDLSTFSYIHGGLDFSDRRLRLARGLTLDKEDNIVLVGFEKFFCLNQLDNRDWLSDNFKEEFCHLQKQDKYKAVEKLDGSMVILGVYKDQLITSTTSSIDNNFSNLALEYFRKLERAEEIKQYLKNRNSCFVFEYISPKNQIAVKYEKEDMVLLAEVSKETQKEITVENYFNFTQPEIRYYTYEELEDIKENAIDIEGFIVENNYGRKIKVKTNWWYEAKAPNTMFFSRKLTKANIKEIVKAYLEDYLDELYSIQNQNEMYKQDNRVGRVEQVIKDGLKKAQEIANKHKNLRSFYNSNDFIKKNALNKLIIAKIRKSKLRQEDLVNYVLSKIGEN